MRTCWGSSLVEQRPRVGLAVPFRAAGGVTQIVDGLVDRSDQVGAELIVLVPDGAALSRRPGDVRAPISPLPRPGHHEIVRYLARFPARQRKLAREMERLGLDAVVAFGLNVGDIVVAARWARVPVVLSLNSDRGTRVAALVKLAAQASAAVFAEGPGVQRRLLGTSRWPTSVNFLPPVDDALTDGGLSSRDEGGDGVEDAEGSALVLGMLCNYTEQKNHSLALSSVAELRARGVDVRLRLAGSLVGANPYRDQVLARIGELGLRDVVDPVGWTSPRELCAGVDALLVTSAFEGVATSTIEGMALGRPFFAAPVGSLPDLSEVSDGGWCAEPDTVDRAPQRLADLIEHHATPRSELVAAGVRGREFVVANCTWSSFLSRFDAVIGRAIST